MVSTSDRCAGRQGRDALGDVDRCGRLAQPGGRLAGRARHRRCTPRRQARRRGAGVALDRSLRPCAPPDSVRHHARRVRLLDRRQRRTSCPGRRGAPRGGGEAAGRWFEHGDDRLDDRARDRDRGALRRCGDRRRAHSPASRWARAALWPMAPRRSRRAPSRSRWPSRSRAPFSSSRSHFAGARRALRGEWPTGSPSFALPARSSCASSRGRSSRGRCDLRPSTPFSSPSACPRRLGQRSRSSLRRTSPLPFRCCRGTPARSRPRSVWHSREPPAPRPCSGSGSGCKPPPPLPISFSERPRSSSWPGVETCVLRAPRFCPGGALDRRRFPSEPLHHWRSGVSQEPGRTLCA